MRSRRTSGAKSKPKERVGLGGGSVDKHLSKPKASNWMSIGDGNTEQVRVVDTDEYFKDGYVHQVEFERKDKSTYTMDIRCLDPDDEGEPCPGCRDELDRRYKFWMLVILRANGEDRKKDEVRILSGANRLVKALNAKQKKRDLSRRDIEISQEGTGREVAYEVEWATDEDEPLSKADKQLLETERAAKVVESFNFYTELRDEDSFYDEPSRDDDDDDEDVGSKSKRRGSGFAATRKKAGTSRRSSRDEDDDDEDDDDEDDDDERPAKKKAGFAGIKAKKSAGSVKPKIRSRR